MGRSRRKINLHFNVVGALDFLNQLAVDRPLYLLLIPFIFLLWAIERWVFCLSTWVPLAVAVWAVIQYGCYQRQILIEDLNRRWRRIILDSSPTTALEHCQWLNKLLTVVWPHYINPALSVRFSSIVEKRLKRRRPRFIEKIELQEFSLGSCPPNLGIHGVRWSTLITQRIMHLNFDWETSEMSIMLLAKLAKPLYGTARIVINHLHIKGDLQLMPALEGRAILYSFLSIPEVKIGVAFGSGGSESLPATELPGVSSWLVKIFSDTLVKTMVEPRRRCLSLTAVNLRKKAVGGILYVTVVAANHIARQDSKGSPTKRQQSSNMTGVKEGNLSKDLNTFVEVELEELMRRTHVKPGSSPRWDSTFNMVLHDNTGTVGFNLYECSPGSVKFEYLASCEIKIKYADDESTIFWAVGPDSGVIARHADTCGKEVEMNIPFEGVNSGELLVRLMLKEWQFSDGSHSPSRLVHGAQQSIYGSTNFSLRTGRKLYVTIVEAKDLVRKEKSGKFLSYVKLHYGKAVQRTSALPDATNPVWNQKFEFEEIGDGEYLKLKCLCEETFLDENIGIARVNLEGLVDGSLKDVWVPLEKVNSGELRLQIEAVRIDDPEGSKGSMAVSGNGWIELVLVEGKDLVAADLRGTSDPYVKVQYGNIKRKTKLLVRLMLKEWQFSDGSHSSSRLVHGAQQSIYGSTNFSLRTGRKLYVTIVEAKDLVRKEKSGKFLSYVKLHYGKAVQRTSALPDATNPVWNQKFEFEEIGDGEYLKLKCLCEETFLDENIGIARVNLEGLVDGSLKDVWVPLEKVNSGELRLQIEAVRIDDPEGSKGSMAVSGNGWIELVLVEGKDLVAADLRGTSDPYVKVQYGNIKRKTKVMYKNLNPQWNQSFEFPDDGSPLVLQVKDHNAIFAAASIGECMVEYQRLPPNQTYDQWIPLQSVKKGELHIQITRKVRVLQTRTSVDSNSFSIKAQMISRQMKQQLMKLQSLAADAGIEGMSAALSELESLEDMEEEYLLQLETERAVLLNKINELGQELLNSAPSSISRSSSS